jgi:AraC-like DNA-binding protein
MHSTTYALDSTWRPLLKDLGISSVNVLRRAGLAEDLLNRSGVRLEAADFHRFWEGIDAELADPLLPLNLCRAVRSESFSPPIFAALCSPNLLVAVQRIARFKALVAPMRLDVREDAHQLTVGFVWPENGSRPPTSLVMTELLFIVTLARIGTREPIQPQSVTTTAPPTHQDAYVDFLGIRIQKGKRHSVVFSRSDADRSFLTSNEGLWSAFEPELRTRLAQLDASVTVGQRVRSVLLEALPGGGIEMEDVARRIAMSRRSLQRHLESEGLTYTDLLQSTRHALAEHYLVKTDLPVAEISFLLGFEEPNSFFRAFRGWCGQSPERFREASRALVKLTQ